jgi:hypothetical protein
VSSAALVIGVDAYSDDVGPLTSAVNDARRFGETLVETGMVEEDDVTLLVGEPGSPDAADSASIKKALLRVYRNGSDIDRFFFYFAGHGLLAFRDGAQTEPISVLLPIDVATLSDDGDKMLVFDEVLSYLRLAGPKEQLYFLDACRNLPYEKQPKYGSLGWDREPPGPTRAQAVLYAVSLMGEALAAQDGFGAMSDALVGALAAEGCALDYALFDGGYIVTMESIQARILAKLRPLLATKPEWRRKFMEPELASMGPRVRPLRHVADPPHPQFTVHVTPDGLAGATEVVIGLGDGIVEARWPPTGNHEPVTVRPRLQELRARSTAGIAYPAHSLLDVRELEETTVRILSEPPHEGGSTISVNPGPPPGPQPGPRGRVRLRGRTIAPGNVQVDAGGLPLQLDVIGLEPPYTRHTRFGQLEETVPAGGYRVVFRIGREPLHERTLYVAPGARVNIGATDDLRASWEYYEPCEVQILAGSPARAVTVGIPTLTLPEQWSEQQLFAAVSANGVTIDENPMSSLETSSGAYAFASFAPPDGHFDVVVFSEVFGSVHVPSAVLADRSTSIIVRLSDGRLDVAQSMVVPPPGIRFGDAVRDVVLARQLARPGQLLDLPDAVLASMIQATRLDPLIACMLHYAAPDRPDILEQTGLTEWTDLSDARVALATADPSREAELLESLLEDEAIPLLTSSVAALASYARKTGRDEHAIVRRRGRLRPEQAFAVEWQGPGLSGRETAARTLDRGSPGTVGARPSFA